MCVHVQDLAEVLKLHTTLRVLNIESNRITRKGIKVTAKFLLHASCIHGDIGGPLPTGCALQRVLFGHKAPKSTTQYLWNLGANSKAFCLV